MTKLNSLIQDPQEWPQCPKCKAQSLLVGGLWSRCCRCNFFGTADQAITTELARYARIKMVSRFHGARGVLCLVGNRQDDLLDQDCARFDERCAELGKLLSFAPAFHCAKRAAQQNPTHPVALQQKVLDSDMEVVDLMSDRDWNSFLERALSLDAAALIYEGCAEDVAARSRPESKPNALLMEIHVYNAPSIVMASRFETQPDGSRTFLGDEILIDTVPSIVWQPIYWPIIDCVPGKLSPRYVAVLEFPGDINLTFSVIEDLDGSPRARIAFRKPFCSEPAEIREYPIESVRQGISLMKEKFQHASVGADPDVLSHEIEWKRDTHALQCLYDIRTHGLWRQYAKARD